MIRERQSTKSDEGSSPAGSSSRPLPGQLGDRSKGQFAAGSGEPSPKTGEPGEAAASAAPDSTPVGDSAAASDHPVVKAQKSVLQLVQERQTKSVEDSPVVSDDASPKPSPSPRKAPALPTSSKLDICIPRCDSLVMSFLPMV